MGLDTLILTLVWTPAICLSPCPIQGKSRERHEAGTGGGGRGMRVQRRTPPPGSRSCTVLARRSARHWGPMAADAKRGHTATHRFVPAAVDRRPRRRARPPETVSPPGVVQSRLRNTARGTPESWRTCGYFDIERRFFEKHRSAWSLRGDQARGSVEDPASRAPFLLSRVRSFQTSGAKRAARMRAAD